MQKNDVEIAVEISEPVKELNQFQSSLEQLYMFTLNLVLYKVSDVFR